MYVVETKQKNGYHKAVIDEIDVTAPAERVSLEGAMDEPKFEVEPAGKTTATNTMKVSMVVLLVPVLALVCGAGVALALKSKVDVYYIVTQTNPETKQSNNVLVKRGKQLHGPDRMYVNPNQIVFVEPVGSGSKVAQLIA